MESSPNCGLIEKLLKGLVKWKVFGACRSFTTFLSTEYRYCGRASNERYSSELADYGSVSFDLAQ